MDFKKKIIALTTAAVFVSFSGCSQTPDSTPNQTETSATTTSQTSAVTSILTTDDAVSTTKNVTEPESSDPMDWVTYGYQTAEEVLNADTFAMNFAHEIDTELTTADTCGIGMVRENSQVQLDISVKDGVWTTTLSNVDCFNVNDRFLKKWELSGDPVTRESSDETDNYTTCFTIFLAKNIENVPQNCHIGANIVNKYVSAVYYTENTSEAVSSIESAFTDSGWDKNFYWIDTEGVSTEGFIVGTSPMIKNVGYAPEPDSNAGNDTEEKSSGTDENGYPYIIYDNFRISFKDGRTYTTIDNKYSDYNGSIALRIPVAIKNIGNETDSLNMFAVTLYGTKGTELDSIQYLFDDGDDLYTKLRPDASIDACFYILYDGEGKYFISFGLFGKIETEVSLNIELETN